jgi:hypothetical protein
MERSKGKESSLEDEESLGGNKKHIKSSASFTSQSSSFITEPNKLGAQVD